MMVETILESSQDFGMSNGVLPQWKRELLQRRAARSRPAPAAPLAPPPAPPAPLPEEDEELRYGPGIVKRLKSRYLSLALRDAPRRRPSVLRRAASLEHLLDERPPPAPRPQRQRPVSLAPPCNALPRRDSVKRARSVDALSRLETREEPPPSPPPPTPPAAPPLPPRPPTVRAARPPRRPAPLLRDTERPPPDVVKSTLRKFESAPTRRTAPAARVSAVLRGLESGQRSSTPEPRDRSPSPPAADISAIDEPEGPCLSTEVKTVSRAALEGIALAGSTVRYSFEAPKRGSHLPLVSASNPVLLGRARLSASPRRIGVIRPMPAPTLERSMSTPAPMPEEIVEKIPDVTPRIVTPPPSPVESPTELSPRERKDPPSAVVEPIPRSPPEDPKERSVTPPRVLTPEPIPETKEKELNGHAEERPIKLKTWKSLDSGQKEVKEKENGEVKSWVRGGSPGAARRARGPPPAATSVVFNFSARKDVPDYIENDGIILRNKRDKIKASDPGVVVLRPEALAQESESEEEDAGPPSPCSVRFINDNVLINGKSSMPCKPDRQRTARLKIQFDDSLTRTFEYPSETSLCEEGPPAPPQTPPPPAHVSALAANTHIASAALSRYQPSKTLADAFQLGVTRHEAREQNAESEPGADEGDARPCAADAARSWSEARTHATDLLF